jgi:hypothetical protein
LSELRGAAAGDVSAVQLSRAGQYKFCPKCATALAAPTVAAERDTQAMLSHAIERLIPKELAERLLATRGPVSTERRLVTILLCRETRP